MSVVTEWQPGFVARENLGRVVGRMRIAARNAGVLWILLAAQLLEVVDLKFAYDCKFLLWFTQRKATHSVYTVVVWKFQKILFQSLLLWPPTSTYSQLKPSCTLWITEVKEGFMCILYRHCFWSQIGTPFRCGLPVCENWVPKFVVNFTSQL